MPLKPTYIDPDNPSQLREPRANDTFINEPDVSFDTISDMTDYKIGQSPRTKTANVMGYYSAGDGGGGTFYWDSNSTEPDDGGYVFKPSSFSSSDPGRWKRPTGFSLSFKDYGAYGDYDVDAGTGTDDTAAIQSALSFAAQNSRIKYIKNDKAIFLVTQSLSFDGLDGVTFLGNSMDNTMIYFKGISDETASMNNSVTNESISASLTSDISGDDLVHEIPVSDASLFSEGDYIILNDSTDLGDFYTPSEYNIVSYVDTNNNVIRTHYPWVKDHTASDVTFDKRTGMINNFNIRDMSFQVEAGLKHIGGINGKNCNFERVKFIGNGSRRGPSLGGFNVKMKNCVSKGFYNTSGSASLGYGASISGLSVGVYDSEFEDHKHAVTCASRSVFSKNLEIKGNTVIGSNRDGIYNSLDFHGAVYDGTIEDNYLTDGGILLRANDCKVKNNTIYQKSGFGIYVSADIGDINHDIEISGNKVSVESLSNTDALGAIHVRHGSEDIQVFENEVLQSPNFGIYIGNSGQTKKRIHIYRNRVKNCASANIYLFNGYDSEIKDNKVTTLSGVEGILVSAASGSAPDSSNIEVNGNEFYGDGDGFKFGGDVTSDIWIENNKFYNSGSPVLFGGNFNLSSITDVTFKNNKNLHTYASGKTVIASGASQSPTVVDGIDRDIFPNPHYFCQNITNDVAVKGAPFTTSSSAKIRTVDGSTVPADTTVFWEAKVLSVMGEFSTS